MVCFLIISLIIIVTGDKLSLCKPSCIFINVGRDSVINTDSLLNAIQQKWIALDVFESEFLVRSLSLYIANIVSNSARVCPQLRVRNRRAGGQQHSKKFEGRDVVSLR